MNITTVRRQSSLLQLDVSGSMDIVIYDESAKKSVTFSVKRIIGDIVGEANPSVILDCTGAEDTAPTTAFEFSKFAKCCDQNANVFARVDVTGTEIDNGIGNIDRPITGVAVYKEVVNNQVLVKMILKAPLNIDNSF